jgi:hypothetical protein
MFACYYIAVTALLTYVHYIYYSPIKLKHIEHIHQTSYIHNIYGTNLVKTSTYLSFELIRLVVMLPHKMISLMKCQLSIYLTLLIPLLNHYTLGNMPYNSII